MLMNSVDDETSSDVEAANEDDAEVLAEDTYSDENVEETTEVVEAEAEEAEPELTFLSDDAVADDELPPFDDISEKEEVIKTELPFDFFSDDSSLEFVDSEADAEEKDNSEIKTLKDMEKAESDERPHGFSVDIGHLNFSADDIADDDKAEPEDIPVSKGFSINKSAISSDLDMFEAEDSDDFENVEPDEDDGDKTRKKGFFRRK